MEDTNEGVGATNGHATWTSAMSAFMLSHLTDVVATGLKTSKGFKKHFYNGCARALNEKFKTMFSGDQVKNHLKTWQKKWSKIIKLKKLSAAIFDEDNCIITLDDEHYNGYVKDHKSDAEFLNKPIMHYKEMEAIFGNSMATGNFAKDTNASLGRTDDEADSQDEDEEINGQDHQGATSSSSRPSASGRPKKKAKIIDIEDEGLISVFKTVGENIAEAIRTAAKSENEVPDNLFQILNSFPGFNTVHVSAYHLHLCSNPIIARSSVTCHMRTSFIGLQCSSVTSFLECRVMLDKWDVSFGTYVMP